MILEGSGRAAGKLFFAGSDLVSQLNSEVSRDVMELPPRDIELAYQYR